MQCTYYPAGIRLYSQKIHHSNTIGNMHKEPMLYSVYCAHFKQSKLTQNCNEPVTSVYIIYCTVFLITITPA